MPTRPTRPARLLLVASNGFGMGHLTRQLSVALAAGDLAMPTIFSFSAALPVVRAHGLAGEYCATPDRRSVPEARWHGYLRDRLVALAREVDAQVIAYDGVAPYPGIGLARPQLRDVAFVWMRRGMWRPGANVVQLDKTSIFDMVVEPGDLAGEADRGATANQPGVVRVPPITMSDVIEPLGREDAATALGIDPQRPTVLVTLGSGRLGDIEALGAMVVPTLLEDPDWQICVTRASIARQAVPLPDTRRVIELRGVYPLVRYLAAFDAAVSAAGYNAVHELLPAGVPTLFVPNPETLTDDQGARARWLADQALALTALPEDHSAIEARIRSLSDEAIRSELSRALGSLPPGRRGGGAEASARVLADLAGAFVPAPTPVVERIRRLERAGKEQVKAALGPRSTDLVRRMLGRQELGGVQHKVAVTVVADPAQALEATDGFLPLLLSDDIPDDLIRSGQAVEHMIPGASEPYRRRRREIIETYFEVRSPDATS